MNCCIDKAERSMLTLTSGTKPMTFAQNSEQSVFARSAVELKELREVKYERIQSNGTY